MRCSALLVCGAALLLFQPPLLISQRSLPVLSSADSDRDGLSDELEQSLLEEFTPTFMMDPLASFCIIGSCHGRARVLSLFVKRCTATLNPQAS
jgi:hypothetical protein